MWLHTPFPYTIYDFALRPKRIPFNAFVSGPTAGGAMPPSSHPAPQAISAEWWKTVCPKHKRRIINSRDAPNDLEGNVLIEWWICALGAVSDGYIEIERESRV